MPMLKRSQRGIPASTGDSMGKPTGRFLLASTADSVLLDQLDLHLDLQNWSKTSNIFGRLSCCRQLARKKAAVESLTLSGAASSKQAVDNTKTCQTCSRHCSGFPVFGM